MKLEIKAFGGVAPKQNPRLLPAEGAQIALNCEAVGGTVRPLRGTQAVASPVFALGSATEAKTLYRFGQDEPTDSRYWLGWSREVDVCRSQVAGDTMEWTFYSVDNSYPKMFNTVTKGQANNHWRLGIPAPYGDPEDSSKQTQKLPLKAFDCGPSLFLTEIDWRKFKSGTGYYQGIDIYFLDERPTFNQGNDTPKSREVERIRVKFNAVDFDTIVAALQAAAFTRGKTITANAKDKTIAITADATYAPYTMYLSWGGYYEYFEKVTFKKSELTTPTATSTYTLPVGAVGAPITPGWKPFRRRYGFTLIQYLSMRTAPPENKTRYGSYRLSVDLTVDGTATNALNNIVDAINTATIDGDLKASVENGDLTITYTWNPGTYNDDVGAWIRYGLWVPGNLYYKWIYYVENDAGVLSSTASQLLNEERVYAWTWICDTSKVVGMGESALVMESPPSPPSDPIKVSSTGSLVEVTFPPDSTAFTSDPNDPANQGTVKVTGKRLYRATGGEYLLVAELGLGVITYYDAMPANFLGEALATMDDAVAPLTLRGLINLPNGMMAGYDGRDLHFCRPYVPYAWPAGYSQTLDYPIVGLGRIDTTLVALTKGVPYFIQGSAPDLMVAVKSDIEQACVSKRSIVSMGGAVLFASPDGLVLLSTSGSRNVTETLFRREQWQTLLGADPQATFHAYGHNNQYIAFHGKVTESYTGGVSVDYYGFIYDLATGQFTRHSLSTLRTGYADLRNDQLFLIDYATLTRWGNGNYLPALWRSKKFSLPQLGGFSCAQVEADNDYAGLKATLFRDGTKVTTELTGDALSTLTTTRLEPRYPFRLESKQGRDWEVQLEWTASTATPTEVFNVVIAQSMSEIASA